MYIDAKDIIYFLRNKYSVSTLECLNSNLIYLLELDKN